MCIWCQVLEGEAAIEMPLLLILNFYTEGNVDSMPGNCLSSQEQNHRLLSEFGFENIVPDKRVLDKAASRVWENLEEGKL